MDKKYLNITKDIVLNFINKESITVFLFGSRTGNYHSHNSDIDIGFLSNTKLDVKIYKRIRETLEESIVPYNVDLVDFNKVGEEFKREALKDIEIWNQAKNININ